MDSPPSDASLLLDLLRFFFSFAPRGRLTGRPITSSNSSLFCRLSCLAWCLSKASSLGSSFMHSIRVEPRRSLAERLRLRASIANLCRATRLRNPDVFWRSPSCSSTISSTSFAVSSVSRFFFFILRSNLASLFSISWICSSVNSPSFFRAFASSVFSLISLLRAILFLFPGCCSCHFFISARTWSVLGEPTLPRQPLQRRVPFFASCGLE